MKRLHELTGWAIINIYEEPGVGLEGTFTCHKGYVTDRVREYRPRCSVCNKKRPMSDFSIDSDVCVCDACWHL